MATLVDSDLDSSPTSSAAPSARAPMPPTRCWSKAPRSASRAARQPEKLERAESHDLGLRVFVGKRQAIVSTTDARQGDEELVDARRRHGEGGAGRPVLRPRRSRRLAREVPDLDLCDPVEPPTEILGERARAAEETALAVPGITNSEGAEAGWGRSARSLAASNGFTAQLWAPSHSVSVAVLAGEGTGMERDYDYSSACTAAISRRRRGRAARGGARGAAAQSAQGATAKCPSSTTRASPAACWAIWPAPSTAPAIARGTSFLKDKLGQRLFAEASRSSTTRTASAACRSKPFDGEGMAQPSAAPSSTRAC